MTPLKWKPRCYNRLFLRLARFFREDLESWVLKLYRTVSRIQTAALTFQCLERKSKLPFPSAASSFFRTQLNVCRKKSLSLSTKSSKSSICAPRIMKENQPRTTESATWWLGSFQAMKTQSTLRMGSWQTLSLGPKILTTRAKMAKACVLLMMTSSARA